MKFEAEVEYKGKDLTVVFDEYGEVTAFYGDCEEWLVGKYVFEMFKDKDFEVFRMRLSDE